MRRQDETKTTKSNIVQNNPRNPQITAHAIPSHRVKLLLLVILPFLLCAPVLLTGCASHSSKTATSQGVEVRVAALKGPTAIGLVELMEKAEQGETTDSYSFDLCGTADEIVQKVMADEVDIALVPANTASLLYWKTDKGVAAFDINTLSVLDVVTQDSTIASIADLAGKTVYMTGKGTTPEYVMRYLLDMYGISSAVNLEFKSEPAEVVAYLQANPSAIGVLPQPYATACLEKVANTRIAIELGDAWQEVAPNGSQIVTGVTIATTDFIEQHHESVVRFMSEQDASIDEVNVDPAGAATLVVKEGILDSETIAEKAIPYCSLTFLDGSDLKTALTSFYSVLYTYADDSLGEGVPPSDFYFEIAPSQG